MTEAECDWLVQVKSKLGPDRTPHLCQLFVTADSYGSNHIRFGGAVSINTGLNPANSAACQAKHHLWEMLKTHICPCTAAD